MAFSWGRAFKDWWQSDLTKPVFKPKATLEPGVEFEGKLTISSGTSVRLNSHFKGEIGGEGTILVAERGELEAAVTCKAIVILGKLTGRVHAAERIEIKRRGVVVGELSTPTLVVEPGGYFDGQCHMPAEILARIAEVVGEDHAEESASSA
ncbi:MAG TPA: polymer-forming cytoskeletal protein [Terriglobia bacterium]|nr:polymer-forming cytoskeletal protein [Terriglobia bacterium]